ncbi:hypothetical protein [Microcystis aeruginosa]
MSVGALIEFYFKLIICITIPEEPSSEGSTAANVALIVSNTPVKL